jgi:colanic acid biosynthesis glycosyl transferase WcaI
VPEVKRWYFPNWVPDGDERPKGLATDRRPSAEGAGPLPDFRRTHGIAPEAFLAIYSGNVGNKQGLGVLLDAALLLARENPAAAPPIEIVIAGDGAARASLAARHATLDLRRVRLLPLQSDVDYRAMLQTAQVALITQEKGTGQFFFPSKLLTVLGAGLTVLAVADEESELARALRQGDCGFVVPPGEPAALAKSLREIAATPPATLAALRSRGTQFVGTFSARFVLPAFETKLVRLTQAKD